MYLRVNAMHFRCNVVVVSRAILRAVLHCCVLDAMLHAVHSCVDRNSSSEGCAIIVWDSILTANMT